MSDTAQATIRARVVAINQTRYYNIPEKWREVIDQIYAVYVFDLNEATHCCEITPSRYLVHIDQQFRPRIGVEYDDEMFAEIDEWVRSGENESVYMHCRAADQLTPIKEQDWEIGEDETRDEVMERILDHFAGNQVDIGILRSISKG